MFRRGGSSTAFLIDNVRKVHTTFPDGSELVEEYDAETHRILVRKRRRPATTGAAGSWEVLLGDTGPPRALPPLSSSTSAAAAAGGLMLQESSSNPRCVRVDTPGRFTWTISNLHYPSDTYSITLAADGGSVVVATTNKKYYKRLGMPEMQLLQLAAEESRLSWSHDSSRGVLEVHYAKPPALLAEEVADAKAAAAMRAQEAPTDCRQQ